MKAVLVDVVEGVAVTLPDTAVERAPLREDLIGRPVVAYLPDCAGGCDVSVCLAVRVSGACKALEECFALRYINGVALALLVSPCGMLSGVRAGVLLHDGAVQLAPWSDVDGITGDNLLVTTLGGYSAMLPWNDVPKAMSVASRQMTLRTGDVVLVKVAELPAVHCLPATAATRYTTVAASTPTMSVAKRFK